MAPATAARRASLPPVRPAEVAETAAKLATEYDVVLIEGAGGLLVRFDDEGGTLADAAELLNAPVLLVTSAGLGTLNATELTARELSRRDVYLTGLTIGSWPDSPDLAARCNLTDLPLVAGALSSGHYRQVSAHYPRPTSAQLRQVGWPPRWAERGTHRSSGTRSALLLVF